jgi:type IV pilus assembly protein PilB
MDDPTNEQALSKIRELAGLPVKPMVAPPTEIRDAIRVYYFGGKRKKSPAKAAQKKPKQKEPPPPPADAKASSESGGAAEAGPGQSGEAAQVSDGPSEAAGAGAEAASGSASESAEQPASEAREKGENRARKAATKASQKMITLTLLDGTEVRLPAARKKGGGGEEAAPASEPATGAGGMTAGDLVQALLARAEGQDTSDLLPNAQWETFFATMLTLLLRKGLIADWEFVEEWRKHQGGEQ